MSTLKLRWITAIILCLLLGSLLVYGTRYTFISALFVIWAIAALEWSALFAFNQAQRILFLSLGPWLALFLWTVSPLDLGIFSLGLWVMLFIWCGFFEITGIPWRGSPLPSMLLGYSILLPMLIGLWQMYIAPGGVALILGLVALVSGSDIIAFFAGRAFGKHRLAKRLSPGKTLEGSLAALFSAPFIAYLLGPCLGVSGLAWILMASGIVFAAMVGDLYESMLKRFRGVKDSGRCLPGHGGILDRLDSLTAATPLYVLGLDYLARL